MTFDRIGWLAPAGCLFLVLSGCGIGDGGGSAGVGGGAGAGAGGGGGAGGAGGVGGTGGESTPPASSAGLWQGVQNGVEVCFFVSRDGSRLEKSATCILTAEGEAEGASNSFALNVDLVGRDENGESCSFGVDYSEAVPIDQATGAFRVVDAPMAGGGSFSFSGAILGEYTSGMARSEKDGVICQLAWGASPSRECDEAAINACLDLQNCCEAILVNPIFFATCNSVVLQCDKTRCEELLAGYPQCAPEE